MTSEIYKPQHPVRFVTAASLFDGHDASINLFRRLLQGTGVEVIHLGHDRSVDLIVDAAIQEDVQGIAVSSYQGGHMEFFKYMVDRLRERGGGHIKVFAGGGGVIVPREIKELHEYGVARIFSPEDGRMMGLQGMINHMVQACDFPTVEEVTWEAEKAITGDPAAVARLITLAEKEQETDSKEDVAATLAAHTLPGVEVKRVPVVGLTGTGGAGKSSLTDEWVRRFLADFPEKRVAILSIDPSKQRTGGALLGDRIRMNAVHHPRVYMRSLATRKFRSEISAATKDAIAVLKNAGFDLVLVETSGIGQGDADIIEVSDLAVYVMTSEFGAPSQLEKIEMLDYADFVAINKFDRKGSEDALRDVKKQYRRNHNRFDVPENELPVFGTMASRFNDPGTDRFYRAVIDKLSEKCNLDWESSWGTSGEAEAVYIIPPERTHYLRDIASTLRKYREYTQEQSTLARRWFQLHGVQELLQEEGRTKEDASLTSLSEVEDAIKEALAPESKKALAAWPEIQEAYRQEELVVNVRDREIRTPLFTETLSGTKIPKVSLPRYTDWGDILRWQMQENVPGRFPFTAGVFPLKRGDEDPKRMFAGEGTPERTNRRFHYLSEGEPAKRLSTAFDSVTLYGRDPDERPDIYGKIGESGVSICTLEDMKKLYAGFDLCAPSTSVSMTINGPAPIILAMFLNTAMDQQVDKFREKEEREPSSEDLQEIRSKALASVRGTVQADILKEDQGQNTCIFSTEFALKMMGDIQQYFIDHGVRNYYSVSISGYHIAEAGANPISQLAFTLANAFTYVEYYLSRGMKIDQFAPNLSFFFSNGLDAEYAVIGRVARRIWAVVMKRLYGANERSQKLKYHVQTSGRSLHAQEVNFNDIRTTLQALMALNDQCNSLHTNAFDEAITTPTEDSVRRAMAIQMIITKELGLAKNENSLQGSFIIEELTDLVEEAVLQEFERISDRGGVLGAMETQYQRGKIQEESLYYETKKHSGELPIIGVNTFLKEGEVEEVEYELTRATTEEKESQIKNLRAFQEQHQEQAEKALHQLQETARQGGNLFSELIEAVKVASLGQITEALFDVGGQYRRNM
ncbi:methylmalonyl-CoA mutase [Marininema mesophilum]|uniref:Fused isobutyryl-CoA mutase n=1 Tax=Marininema mesophilum TaxID=1048340 RepID=A0A1H2T7X1_9BACL|nr:fused isobutyryl-CoA mutase/GTPase IcmF [Marininema mesophilum]SDW39867.1 methylmalonyl-CoA mutase [Marininema mesophilum]